MKFFLKTIALLLFTASLLTIGVNGIDVSARSAVLIEADTGRDL